MNIEPHCPPESLLEIIRWISRASKLQKGTQPEKGAWVLTVVSAFFTRRDKFRDFLFHSME